MANKLEGSSKRVLSWQVTMDQLICASLSHSHSWYEVLTDRAQVSEVCTVQFTFLRPYVSVWARVQGDLSTLYSPRIVFIDLCHIQYTIYSTRSTLKCPYVLSL